MLTSFLLFTLSAFSFFSAPTTEPDTIVADKQQVRQAVNSFIIESAGETLDIRVFDLEGKRIPCTLWKSRCQNKTRYEAGYDLDNGVYIVRIRNGEEVHYCKLVRRDL